MSKDELHEIAHHDTPDEVSVPNTWPALAVWAVGRFGIGIVFLAMLVLVYKDLRDSSNVMVEVVRANSTAIEALAHRTEQTNQKVDRIEAALTRDRERRDHNRNE